MNRKISLGMAVTIVILAMTVTFSITMLIAMRLFDSTVNSVKEKESMYNKIAEVDRYVRSNDYYTIDEATLYDRLTAGYLLGTGDKYARYYTANAYTELMNIQSGKILGIGVELGIDQTGYAKVTRVYDGSPAQEAGIALRDNGGGILEDAINCIDLIAPEGTVAYAEDKNGNRTVIGSSDAESAVSLPMVCLVNGNTASAAELFAATLRTMNGARLVGTRAARSVCRTAVPWSSRWQSWSAATAAALTAPA